MNAALFVMDGNPMISSIDKMSSLFYNGMSELPLDDGIQSPIVGIDPLQCVNPQYTDMRYDQARESQHMTVSSRYMTPSPSMADLDSRRPSLILSDASDSGNTGPMSASSTSSFSSSPGYPTPCSSSVPTAVSSRRQSVVYPGSQHQYSSLPSPTPSSRPKRLRQALNVDHYSLQEPLSINPQSLCTDTTSFGFPPGIVSNDTDEGLLMSVHDYTERAHTGWHAREDLRNTFPGYEVSSPNNMSMFLGADLTQNFNEVLAARSDEDSQTDHDVPQPSIFSRVHEPHDPVFSQVKSISGLHGLERGFEHRPREASDSMTDSDDELDCKPEVTVNRDRFKAWARKTKQLRGQCNQKIDLRIVKEPLDIKDKHRRCIFESCVYACNRPEHLKRHVKAVHTADPEKFPCAFPDCIDKKTGRIKIILSRGDNHKAHYTKTHFSYGHSEKSGKNRRKSMKVSFEKGLRPFDQRWAMLLAGKMDISQEIDKYLSVWKMLGYSIKETRDMRIKEVAPEWQGPKDATLEGLDPRWKALKSRTLDYDRAMSVGTNMSETPRQGLLGVNMRETEEMGIKHLDPRWQTLLSGEMSIEDSEKLGVKTLNPAWSAQHGRRKRRCDE